MSGVPWTIPRSVAVVAFGLFVVVSTNIRELGTYKGWFKLGATKVVDLSHGMADLLWKVLLVDINTCQSWFPMCHYLQLSSCFEVADGCYCSMEFHFRWSQNLQRYSCELLIQISRLWIVRTVTVRDKDIVLAKSGWLINEDLSAFIVWSARLPLRTSLWFV